MSRLDRVHNKVMTVYNAMGYRQSHTFVYFGNIIPKVSGCALTVKVIPHLNQLERLQLVRFIVERNYEQTK